MTPYLTLMRPHQYVKNLFVFLPMFFGLKMLEPGLWLSTLEAFVAFCATASAVYILNDYRDIEDDRRHPEKRHRPLAAGTVSVRNAFTLMGLLLMIGFALGISANPAICC